MIALPTSESLAINHLSSCFNSTTNAYKYYWFWAILDHLNDSDNPIIDLEELSLRMISLAWYPLDFYKLSFGKSDSFKRIASLISEKININNTPQSKSLYHQINENDDEELKSEIKKEVNHILKRWVTYRFLRPFFLNELKGIADSHVNAQLIKLSNENIGYAPYSFSHQGIIIAPKWLNYLNKNQNILRGFLKWHLLEFIQKNNPNVIGLSEKLEKPFFRNLSNAKKYWAAYLKENKTYCIYSQTILDPKKISLDHFIPWSYLAHDQLWNIVPTTKSINSTKSNSLPSLTYINALVKLQYNSLMFHFKKNNAALIEDYLKILQIDMIDLRTLPLEQFSLKLEIEIKNHMRVAKNLGFNEDFLSSSHKL